MSAVYLWCALFIAPVLIFWGLSTILLVAGIRSKSGYLIGEAKTGYAIGAIFVPVMLIGFSVVMGL